MAPDTNSVIDVGTVARILAVSEATVRNYLASGQLAGQKILGRQGVLLVSVDALLAQWYPDMVRRTEPPRKGD